MVSNRLSSIRRKTANPKVCYPPPPETPPPSTPPPPPPPVWPPPYINARIIALVRGQHFEATLTLQPRNPPPGPITYNAHAPGVQLSAEVILYPTQTPNYITFSEVWNYSPYFYADYGPTVTVQPPTFKLQNSLWYYKNPPDAQITLAIAYPEQP